MNGGSTAQELGRQLEAAAQAARMAMEADASGGSMQESSEDSNAAASEEATARSSKSSKPGGGSTPRGTLPGLQVLQFAPNLYIHQIEFSLGHTLSGFSMAH